MNKKRVALALAAALGVNTLMVTVGQVGEQITVAHAQNARLTGDQVKLLDGIKIKSLSTAVEILSTGEPALTFTDIKKEDIKNVRVTELFSHETFTERKDIDTKVNTGINGTWDSSTGKLKLSSKITQPGIYTGKVEIELNDGTKEVYTVSLRKTPSDSVKFTTTVSVGTVEVRGLVLNNGVGDTTYTITDKNLELTNKRTGMTAKAKAGTSAGSFVFSALDLASDGKLQENDVLELKITYGTGNEYTLTSEILLVKQEVPKIEEALVTNKPTNGFKTEFQASVQKWFNTTSTVDVGTPASNVSNYQAKVESQTLFSYSQTYGAAASDKVGGVQLTPSVTSSGVGLTLGTVTLHGATPAADYFVPDVTLSYGNNLASNGLIGDYYIQADGQSKSIYFDAVGTRVASLDSTAASTNAFLAYKHNNTNSNLVTAITVNPNGYSINVDLDKTGNGYTPIKVEFGVDASSDLAAVSDVNDKIRVATGATKSEAKHKENGSIVSATVVVATDVVDGVHTQAKFEKTSASEGKITLVGGKKIVGTSTDLNNVRLTVGGATASIIGSESTGNDLVFSVQFNGQVPTSIDWTLGVNNTNKVKGALETGVLESTNIKSVKATNNGTSNIKDQFTVEADFNLTFPNSTTKVTVDGLNSDRVTSDQFKAGDHTVNIQSASGKYQGTYKAGVIVTRQNYSVDLTKVEARDSSSATLTIDASSVTDKALDKVNEALIQYREVPSTGTNNNAWVNSTTKFEVTGTNKDIKEDPITKVVSGLTGGKKYEFRVVYRVKNGNTVEEEVISNVRDVTLPTSSSSNTITGNGSSSTTTGTSTGSTTITVTTSNSTLTGTSASVTLPSGFRYDSGKTPVVVTFKYKDKDGKIVTETKEQYSNVTAKFNGNNVELNGLVPGKDYNEITVDYTDNNGKTRSIILKNVKTTSQTQVETYLANVYEVVFGRPADEAGYHFHLDNLKNKKVSLRDFLLNMLNEKEFVEKYKSTEEKIEALYNAIVNRTSDEAGKKFWVDEYKKVLAVYGSETTALKAIADRMVNENELKELADKMGVQW